MAARRVLKKFPLNLNIGTDICHVVRIRNILESARAKRFIQKVLNAEERGHPKIQWMLAHDASASTAKRACPPGQMQGPRVVEREARELQVAATFLAGRCAVLHPRN